MYLFTLKHMTVDRSQYIGMVFPWTGTPTPIIYITPISDECLWVDFVQHTPPQYLLRRDFPKVIFI